MIFRLNTKRINFLFLLLLAVSFLTPQKVEAYALEYIKDPQLNPDFPICEGDAAAIILILKPTGFFEVFTGSETLTGTYSGLYSSSALTMETEFESDSGWTFCGAGDCPIGTATVPVGAFYKYAWVDANEAFYATVSWTGGSAEVSGRGNLTFPQDEFCLQDDVVFPNYGFQYSTDPDIITLPTGVSQSDTEIRISPLAAQSSPFTLYKIYDRKNMCPVRQSSIELNVYAIPDTELRTDTVTCEAVGDLYDLNLLRVNPGSVDGIYTITAIDDVALGTPLTVTDGMLEIPATPTCYTIEFNVDGPGASVCDFVAGEAKLYVVPGPDPTLTLLDDSGEPFLNCQCTTGGNITGTFTATGVVANHTYTVSSTDGSFVGSIDGSAGTFTLPAPLFNDATDAVNDVVYTICVEETGTEEVPCSGAEPEEVTCVKQNCVEVLLYSVESGCDENRVLDNTCKPELLDVCPISPNPKFKLKCSYFPKIPLFDVLTMDAEFDQNLLLCGEDEMATGTFENTLIGISGADINTGPILGELPGVNILCALFQQDFAGVKPFETLYNLIGCERSLGNFVVEALALALGGTGSGYIVRADTDGDGAFDYTAEQGTGTASGSFSVPNNVKGSGYITVRAVYAWPRGPRDVCGELVRKGKDLIDILPLGVIPVVGPIIEEVLDECSVITNWSAEKTITIPVINESLPEFQNCYDEGLVFNLNSNCTSPVEWSAPVAFEGCSEDPLVYKGYTSTADDSEYIGTGTPVAVTLEDEGAGVYQILGPIPGSELDAGVYDVHYLAVGCNGKPDTCKFQVLVTEGTPTLACPADITASTEVDQCQKQLFGLEPTSGAGCNTVLNYSYINPVSGTEVSTSSTTVGEPETPNGNFFELGTTTITYTLNVDLNEDGDFDDDNETQTCSFTITIEDNQRPDAVCSSITVQLDNTGMATINATGSTNSLDGGSTDNCDTDLTITISENGTDFLESIDVSCEDVGYKYFTVRVEDDNGNVSDCRAEVEVLNFFEDFQVVFDAPEFCLEPFQETIDLSNYVSIVDGNGNIYSHEDISDLGDDIVGEFKIATFVPSDGGTLDHSISPDGVFTQGDAEGYLTVMYMISIDGQVTETDNGYEGCYAYGFDLITIQDLDPIWTGGDICCDQSPVWLGGAGFEDGTTTPTIPDGMLSLTDIGGSYPVDAYGEWTGAGVSFQDPDGVAASGDEFFQFDPTGLDGPTTLTYIIGDEPCIFTHVQDIEVTCQDLQRALDDIEVCPGEFVELRVVDVNFDDEDIVISTTGLAAAGGVDLDMVPVENGKVTIPGFDAVAVRNDTFEITVFADQTTNDFGCSDMFVYNIFVIDTIAPVFQNCPKEPVTVEANSDQCGAFVNFEEPWALDNCMGENALIEKVDTTGLNTGDFFPVGTTIMAYTATDTVGNQSYCEIKIVVLDFEVEPSISCPADLTVGNDMGQCGAEVFNIEPTFFIDNCLDNSVIQYEIENPDGSTTCGFADASGEFFDQGTSEVTYTIYDQPLLLISEIVQDGTTAGVEISNFGPADLDVTCLSFYMKDASGAIIDSVHVISPNNKAGLEEQTDFTPPPTVWEIPSPNLIEVGGVYTAVFDSIPAVGDEITYCIVYGNYEIDNVTINASVSTEGLGILRNSECDHDAETDWRPVEPCDPATFGTFNPDLSHMMPNGTQTSLQSEPPSMDQCSFNVTVDDLEAPICIMHDSVRIAATQLGTIDPNTCFESIITMPAGIVDDVNIYGLDVTSPDVGEVLITLTSPEGTKLRLIDQEICSGTADILTDLDDWDDEHHPAESIEDASCGPLGQVGYTRPLDKFSTLKNEEGGGDWILQITSTDDMPSTLNLWELEVLYKQDYAQGDTTLVNDTLLCSAEFIWVHPHFSDNCCDGMMTVTYDFKNDVTGVEYSNTDILQTLDLSTNLDGLRDTMLFDVGVTTITYRMIDQFDNINTCSFKVTVNDEENPRVLDICEDRVINLPSGDCYGSLAPVPRTDDNCKIDTILYCDMDGNLIDINRVPIGEYEITMKVIDIYGNVNSTCVFELDVIENDPDPSPLACVGQVNLSLDKFCMGQVTPEMILQESDNRCLENYCIEITDENGELHENEFTIDDIGQTFKVSISDCLGGENSCWGYLFVEKKGPADFICPPDTFVYCNSMALETGMDGKLLTKEIELISCEPGHEITYQDYFENNGTCGETRGSITRTWRLIDGQGKEHFCTQYIEIRPFDKLIVKWPSDFNQENAFGCKEVAESPELLEVENTGYPKLEGIDLFSGHLCDINIGYRDEKLIDANCNGAYEILRFWSIRDECKPLEFGVNPIIHIQSIKVEDNQAPVLHVLPDVTVSAHPWTCSASYEMPDVVKEDDCSSYTVEYSMDYGKVIDGVVTGLQLGTTKIDVSVIDDCNNIAYTEFNITVVDDSPPVVSVIQNLVIGISDGNPNDTDASGKLYWYQVDNGSYDGCSDVKVELRRKAAPSCENVGLDGHNNNNTFNNDGHNEDSAYDTDDGEFVKFCCEDVSAAVVDVNGDGVLDPGYHEVVVRVWDNADGSVNERGEPTYGTSGDHYNESWAYVKVEDNTAPEIVCPANAEIYCDWAIDENNQGTYNTTYEVERSSSIAWSTIDSIDFSKTDRAYAYSTCGDDLVRFADVVIKSRGDGLNDCGIGQFTRAWRVLYSTKNGNNLYRYCYQTITVLGRDIEVVVGPSHESPISTTCAGPTEEDIKNAAPQVNGDACDVVGYSTRIDTFLFEEGTCKKWVVEYKYINWCPSANEKSEVARRYATFMYFDTEKPVIAVCDRDDIEVTDGCNAYIKLYNSATDEGGCSEDGWLKWQVFVDLWNDKKTDVYVTDNYNAAWGIASNAAAQGQRVPYGVYKSGAWTGWIKVTETNDAGYDRLPEGVNWAETVYVKVGNATRSGESKEVVLDLDELRVSGGMSSHSSVWKVSDGCHNDDSCSYDFMVVDRKAPTPYCVSLSTAVMDSVDTVELWARDFDEGSTDNCTAQEDLLFTFNQSSPDPDKLDVEHYFKGAGEPATREEYQAGVAQRWLPTSNSSARMFSCDDVLKSPLMIRVSIWDEKGNTDYCEVELTLTDTDGSCGEVEGRVIIAGTVTTKSGTPISGAAVTVTSDQVEYPRTATTDDAGTYLFRNALSNKAYEIKVHNEGSLLAEGAVNTLDLVKIQRHILKLQDLPTSYDVIAADINNDGRIKANDLLALRKAILGVSDKFPNNTSWRQVDASQSYVDPMLPFPATESVSTGMINSDMNALDFVSVKVGDVDGSVDGLLNNQTHTRSGKTVVLSIDDRVVTKGESYLIEVHSDQLHHVYGYQMALQLEGLELSELHVSHDDVSISSDFVHVDKDGIKLSYHKANGFDNGENVAFITLSLKAQKDGLLSEMISLDDTSLDGQLYMGDHLSVSDVSLEFRSSEATYAVYGAEPNPFKEMTKIGVEISKPQQLEVSITDASGKLIHSETMQGKAGYNEIVLTKEDVPVIGMLYYTVKGDNFNETRKMIRLD